MPSDQLAIEFTHVLPAVFTAVSTSHQNGFRSRFHSVQGLNAAAIEYPSVVQFGHDTQQCIEAADLFWEFLRSPVTHGGKPLAASPRARLIASDFSSHRGAPSTSGLHVVVQVRIPFGPFYLCRWRQLFTLEAHGQQ